MPPLRTHVPAARKKRLRSITNPNESLEKDVASGHGGYLEALVALSGYEGESRDRFVAAVRSGFAKLVAAPEYPEQDRFAKSEALYNLVNEQSESIAESAAAVNNG